MSIGLGGEDWAALQQHMIHAHGSSQSCVPYHFKHHVIFLLG